MNLILRYMKSCKNRIMLSVSLKTIGTLSELLIPYVLEHIIDTVVPLKRVSLVFIWGICMILLAYCTRYFSVKANRIAVYVGKDCIERLRRDLFQKTMNLSGTQFDHFGLSSLNSRMTSDSYNVQDFIVDVQMMGIRSPLMLLGGILITMVMDPGLSAILCVMVPILGATIFFIMRYGIPLYEKVQMSVDRVVQVLREDISGIRVIKALSKGDYEKRRFRKVNETLTSNDIYAGIAMAFPGPVMQLALNIGLVLVVMIGAWRVDSGKIQPGVILAFLTYFNLILQGVMGLNRIFMMSSKAAASAERIGLVLDSPEVQPVLPLKGHEFQTDAHIVFDHVSFSYHNTEEQCLSDISFAIQRGESLGIIGATGSGKTSIINLLMRFYDCSKGGIYVEGRDVRTYEKDALRAMFGVAFQNDIIFNDTLYDNISFGRMLTEAEVKKAAKAANIADFIEQQQDGYQYRADIRGANLSGGQKQRILISRAVAARPEILILDDSSSALDYRTDADLRRAIRTDYGSSTLIMIAQRVSSVRNLSHIIVLDKGRMTGCGTHEELLKTCPVYQEIYQSQMGDVV